MKRSPSLAIARATFLSLVRNKLTTFLLTLMIVFSLLCMLISTVDAGVKYRLFENLMLSSQTLLLYSFAWLYSFETLRREQSDMLFVLPLSTGITRSSYLFGRFLGLSLLLLLVGTSFILLDSLLIYWLENSFVWQPLAQTLITTFGAILAAAIVFCFAITSPAFTAVIYSILFWIIGHGLDELYLFSEQQLSTIAQACIRFFYYVLPNFSWTDLNSAALNRLPTTTWDWFFPILYTVGYSGLLLLLANQLYQKKALTGHD